MVHSKHYMEFKDHVLSKLLFSTYTNSGIVVISNAKEITTVFALMEGTLSEN